MLTVDTSLLQIRPLQYLYTWAILALFGSYSNAFHIPALIFHICCSLMVVYLMRLVLKSAAMAWVVGFIYAIAINVHFAPQMWMVGSSDVLGPLLIFASFALLIKGRRGLSAIAFLASLMFKEFALAMFGVIMIYLMCEKWSEAKPLKTIRWTLGRVWIHCVMALPFLAYKLLFLPSPMKFAPDHPYRLSLTGPHVIRNGLTYTMWLFQTILPFEISHPKRMLRGVATGSAMDIGGVAAVILLIAAAIILGMLRGGKPVYSARRQARWIPGFLFAWAAMGLAPVYFLPNHVFEYYMAYSLPAMLAIIVLLGRAAARRFGLGRRQMIGLSVAFLVCQFVWSGLYVQRKHEAGYFMLKGAYQTATVHEFLTRTHPNVTKNTAFVMAADNTADANALMWGLRDDKALQTWYKDRTLRVFDGRYVKVEGKNIFAIKPPKDALFPGSTTDGEKERIDPCGVICIKVTPRYVAEQCFLK
ncbi:MAG: hypothetical protein ACYC64_02680 [Armatimonadota bacterium]